MKRGEQKKKKRWMHLTWAEQSYGFLYRRYYSCYSRVRHRGFCQIDTGQVKPLCCLYNHLPHCHTHISWPEKYQFPSSHIRRIPAGFLCRLSFSLCLLPVQSGSYKHYPLCTLGLWTLFSRCNSIPSIISTWHLSSNWCLFTYCCCFSKNSDKYSEVKYFVYVSQASYQL